MASDIHVFPFSRVVDQELQEHSSNSVQQYSYALEIVAELVHTPISRLLIIEPMHFSDFTNDNIYCNQHYSNHDYSLLDDVDPDANILQKHNDILFYSSSYCVESSFRCSFSNAINAFYILNLIIRRMPHNFDHFIRLKNALNYNFSILGFTGTWLKSNSVHCYEITWYQYVYSIRKKKRSDGVSLFVSNDI